jgi:hypothetical protein
LGLAGGPGDGPKRITRGPNFLLAGGTQEVHGQMQETALKINEQLLRRGQRLADLSSQELQDIVTDIQK